VGALHVVGVDLELRPGLGQRARRQQQVRVRLLGVGLLGPLADDDATVEHAARAAIEDRLVQLAAVAVRLRVVEQGVVVDVLRAADQDQAVEPAGRARAVEAGHDVVAHQAPPQVHRLRRVAAVPALAAGRRRHVERGGALELDAAMVELRAVRDDHLRHRVREVDGVGPAGVGLDQAGARSPPGDDEGARVGGGRPRGRARRVLDVDRLVELEPFRDHDHRAGIEQRAVERGEGRLVLAVEAVEVRAELLGDRAQRALERSDVDAIARPQLDGRVLALRADGMEFGRVERREVRRAPLLDARVRETAGVEARGGGSPQLADPAGALLGQLALARGEAREEGQLARRGPLGRGARGAHGRADPPTPASQP
jgi:hypothetical protein